MRPPSHRRVDCVVLRQHGDSVSERANLLLLLLSLLLLLLSLLPAATRTSS
jgi:hypothetical protein